MNLEFKNILLGVTGGIAAYKSAELVRLLVQRGVSVQVVMTQAACDFVTPLTFQALSGKPVYTELYDERESGAMQHINLARWADCLLIAPATADFIARIRAGMANDLLSSLCLANDKPLVIAPAMNQAMWSNPATQENISALRQRGIKFIGPEKGEQACGEVGIGRMSEPSVIVNALFAPHQERLLKGKRVLITAGPTREPIDPVRFLSNRSSGKMGYALAEAAAEAGAEVCVVSGPVNIAQPKRVEIVRVETAQEMHLAVMNNLANTDIFIAAAAVADYRVDSIAAKKIKKVNSELILSLTRNPDILFDVATGDAPPFCVGFAAETDDLERYAKDKLNKKNLDMIAANWVGCSEGGFDHEQNALTVYWSNGKKLLPMAPKLVIARQLIELITENYNEKNKN